MIIKLNNISQILTLKSCFEKDGRNLIPSDTDIINNGSIIFDKEKIIAVGSQKEIDDLKLKITKEINLENHCIVPELVDSHTHLIFGGDRSFEYTMRLNGATYEEIYQNNGGIRFTSKQTNALSANKLFDLSKTRIEKLYSQGVGTIEIKSGYGLNYQKEKELTLVIDKLKKHFAPKIQILNTYMAAHAIPLEFKNSDEYLESVVLPLLHELAPLGIIDFVDIFHEENYFDTNDVLKLINEAKKYNIPLKIHADELNDNLGAKIAIENNFISADHLLCTSEETIKLFGKSNTVATLLPGTAFFLGKSLAPAKKYLDAGAKLSIASDFNPGSCNIDNLLKICAISAKNLNLNFAQAFSAITLNASHSLGLKNQGAIVENLRPRFTVFKTNNLDKIFYHWGEVPIMQNLYNTFYN